uniref:Uncharacterized protein n=1 Tax=Chaetoceros debilis TaxID=122233 RepID=A0A7S3QEH5_9STRA
MPTKKRSSEHVVTLPLAGGSSSTNVIRRSSRARVQRQRMTTEVLGFGSVSQETKIIEIQDPLEKKGRQFWMTARNHFLGKWNHREMDWAFYPLSHGRAREVKKSGVRGVHYAAGYRELGQMIEEHGADVSAWPILADEIASIAVAAAKAAAAEDVGNDGKSKRVEEERELSEDDKRSSVKFNCKEDDQSMSTVEMPDMANSDTDTDTDEGNSFETSDQIHPSPDANLREASASSTSNGAAYPSIPSVSPTGNPPEQKGVLARIEHLEEMLELEQKTALSVKGRLSRCEIDVLGQAQNGPLKVRIASLEKEM